MGSEAFAVVMAGGGGTRLWPLSTKKIPKQFLSLNKRSLIQETVTRISPLFPFERICVVTVRGQGELIREHLPEIPIENILEEPIACNTAPCLGFAATFLKRIDPTAVMVSLPADHFIEKEGCLRQALTLGMEVAQKGYLATLGIVPDYPATGYGYIAAGDVLSGSRDAIKAYRVEQFTEKPSLSRAKTFLDEGNYYWNSGIFIWKVERILEEIARHMPELYSGLKEIEKHWETPDLEQVVTEVYRGQKAVSIDHGVMEKASRIAVIPVEMGWNDLGDWNSLSSVLEKDGDGNAIHAKHIGIDTKDSTVFSLQDRLIATIGFEDVVIVDTPEALLVMDRSRAQEVRDIVGRIEREM
ncbi:mannose-1-phosphate guanylyltransferase [Candidatus Bipolaricaulota bacterium]|nr:mannose-1-phosphate guanylyltransferase [Candidatus Bipolaricaulota bacterium]